MNIIRIAKTVMDRVVSGAIEGVRFCMKSAPMQMKDKIANVLAGGRGLCRKQTVGCGYAVDFVEVPSGIVNK